MRVAMIGLGDIAQKAYLPVLATRPDVQLRLVTREQRTLDRLGDAYRIPHRYRDVAALLVDGVDAAFVHAATGAHAALVRPLLEAGVPTYVDKPLDYHLSGARELVDVAERSRCSLMVGFNRRYAPDYVELRALPRTVVLMHKHRHDLPEEVRTAVFDDFIHVVDTLRFLVDGQVTATDVRVRTVAGRVHQIVLHLSTVGQTAVGVMNRAGGGAEERVEVVGDGVQRVVHDLAEVVEQRDGRETRRRRGDWTPVAEQRGIAGACEHFLAAVRSGRVLSARDALGTHEICEQVVEAAGSGPPAAG